MSVPVQAAGTRLAIRLAPAPAARTLPAQDARPVLSVTSRSLVASTYVPCTHHVERRGEPRFDGNLDVAAFVGSVRAAGLEVVPRIGPYVHGELRNGGFPDWYGQPRSGTAPTIPDTSTSSGSGSGSLQPHWPHAFVTVELRVTA